MNTTGVEKVEQPKPAAKRARVRDQAREAVAVMVFSATVSVGLVGTLLLLSWWVE